MIAFRQWTSLSFTQTGRLSSAAVSYRVAMTLPPSTHQAPAHRCPANRLINSTWVGLNIVGIVFSAIRLQTMHIRHSQLVRRLHFTLDRHCTRFWFSVNLTEATIPFDPIRCTSWRQWPYMTVASLCSLNTVQHTLCSLRPLRSLRKTLKLFQLSPSN